MCLFSWPVRAVKALVSQDSRWAGLSSSLQGRRAGCSWQPTPLCFWPAGGFSLLTKTAVLDLFFLSQIVIWFPPQSSVPVFCVASLAATGHGVGRNAGSGAPSGHSSVGGRSQETLPHPPSDSGLVSKRAKGLCVRRTPGHTTSTRCHRLG